MTEYNGWRFGPERHIQTEAGPFVVVYHGGGRAGVRSDPYEINHRNAPAGDIHLKQGTFRAVSVELTTDPETPNTWAIHSLTGYRTDRPSYSLSEPISPLFAKEWAKLVMPAVLEVLGDPAFIEEGETNMWHRNYAQVTGAINRLRETIEKTTEELRGLEEARQGLLRIAPEAALAEVTA